MNTAGTTRFEGNIGQTSPLRDFTTDALGATRFKNVRMWALGTMAANDPVIGEGGVIITNVSGLGDTTFASTIDGGDWIIAENSTLTLGGAVGSTQPLSGFQLASSQGTVKVNGGAIRVLNQIRLNGNSIFDSSTDTTTLESFGGGEIRLGVSAVNSIRGAVDGVEQVVVDTAGVTQINGVVGDNNQRLNSLTTNASGTTELRGGTLNLSGNAIFNDAVVLGTDTIINTDGDVQFNSTLDGAFGLTVNTAGATLFDGDIGETIRISNLTTDAPGSTTLKSVRLRTSGTLTFNDPVTGDGAITLDGDSGLGNTTFASTIDGGDWIINETSILTFGGVVGGLQTPLGIQLASFSATVLINGGSFSTATNQRLRGNLVFDSPTDTTTLQSLNGGEIWLGTDAANTIRGAVDGVESVVVNTIGNTKINGVVGDGNKRLKSLTTNVGGTTELNGHRLNFSGAATFNDAVVLGANTVINAGGDVLFNSTVNQAGFTLAVNRFIPPNLLVNRIPLGNVNSGIAATDNATGPGFILFSVDPVGSRFGPLNSGNSDHLIAVRNRNGQWFADRNQGEVPFTPLATDRLIASVDFDTDTISSLKATDQTILGVQAGFLATDATFQADFFAGKVNDGEFTVDGSYIDVIIEDRFAVGAVKSGIGVADNATGIGFILFSTQDVQDRLGANQFHANHSDHFVAVQFRAGQWFFNNNNTWVPFAPRASDRLIASVDFDADTIGGLSGASGEVNGIAQGFVAGDLTFAADSFAGNVNDGEFTVGGTFFDAPARDVFSLGSVNLGVAVQDNATGQGYILYSIESVQTRFAAQTPINANSANLVAVQVVDGVWFYNDNTKWIQFTPRTSDVLLAKVDFDADTIGDLKGNLGEVSGIASGYTDGDLTFSADTWNGRSNDGEFMVNGTWFNVERRVKFAESVRGGVAVEEAATGTGFIVYSGEDVRTRFGNVNFNTQQSDHFIAVQFRNNRWFFNNNRTWFPFIPRPTDVLIASVDFDADTITGLLGVTGEVNGIRQGYGDGDLTFAANFFEGIDNPGEFTVGGSWFRSDVTVGEATSSSTTANTATFTAARLADSRDASGDDVVSPLDALLVINHLNSQSEGELGSDERLDINNDGVVSPIDALGIINYLSEAQGAEEAIAPLEIEMKDEEHEVVDQVFATGSLW